MLSSTVGDAIPAGDPKVRLVVEGELLEDGAADLSFPDQPPELTADEFEVEAKAAKVEVTRLVEMGVLVPPDDSMDMSQVDILTSKVGHGLEEKRWIVDEKGKIGSSRFRLA